MFVGSDSPGQPGTLRFAANLQGDRLVVRIGDEGFGMSIRDVAAELDHDAPSPRGYCAGSANAKARLSAMCEATVVLISEEYRA